MVNEIICGDSYELLDSLEPNSINLIIISPPYFNCRVYGNETVGRENHPKDYIDNILKFTLKLKNVLANDGSFYLNIGDVYFGTKGFSRNTGKYKKRTL